MEEVCGIGGGSGAWRSASWHLVRDYRVYIEAISEWVRSLGFNEFSQVDLCRLPRYEEKQCVRRLNDSSRRSRNVTDGVVIGADSMATTATRSSSFATDSDRQNSNHRRQSLYCRLWQRRTMPTIYRCCPSFMERQSAFRTSCGIVCGVFPRAQYRIYSTHVPYMGPPNGFGLWCPSRSTDRRQGPFGRVRYCGCPTELKDGKLTFVAMGSGQILGGAV